MKKVFILFGAGLVLMVALFCGLHLWIGLGVKKNIRMATELYPGSPEEALVAYLKDERNPTNDRTHKAVWTLGQIQSGSALPVLYEYYKNDPQGTTCYKKHEDELCQYEIYKAIKAIENGRLFSHANLK